MNNFLPLWNPHMGLGFPVHAEGQTSIFYPLDFIFFKLFPSHMAFSYLIFIYILLIGFFTYFYCRIISLTRLASILAAISFMFCHEVLSHLMGAIMAVRAIVFMPLCLIGVELLLREKQKWGYLVLVIAFTSVVLAGHGQTILYCYLLTSLYLILTIYFDKKNHFQEIIFFVLAVFSSIALSAIQIIPTIELKGLGPRAGALSMWTMVAQSYPPESFKYFLFPAVPPEGISTYLGFFPFIFFLLGFFIFSKKQYFKKSILLIVFFALLAVGKYAIALYAFLCFIPPFNFFRTPAHAIIPSLFFISVLGAMSCDSLSSLFKLKIRVRVLFLGGVVLLTFLDFYRTVDSFNYHRPHRFILSYQDLFKKSSIVSLLKEDKENFRIYEDFGGSPQNVLAQYNLDSVGPGGVYSPLSPDIYQKVFTNDFEKIWGIFNIKYYLSDHPLRDFSSHLQYLGRFDDERLSMTKSNNFRYPYQPFYLYQYKKYLPRFYIVDQVSSYADEHELLKLLRQGIISEKIALVEKENFHLENMPAKLITQMTEGRKKSKEIQLSVSNNKRALLVWNDFYYPGWEVYVDGEKNKLIRVNGLCKGVFLSSGKHNVVFTFNSKSFNLGFSISCISFLFVMLFIGVLFWRSRRSVRS
ncbi:MAG: YfhO family protein [Deltaproteobacteria bacterium]|nr:YfhO family protein [Deltaproteobacteria bacterium]